jgi:hypothetical protein
MRVRTSVIITLAIALTTIVGAQQVGAQQPGDKPASLPVSILPGEIASTQFAVGVPDLGFDPAWEWQALVCHKRCELEPVKLLMTPVKVQPYDGEPLPGHVYAVDGKRETHPLVLMRGLPPGFRARPETWLHAGLENYPPSRTQGTLEIDIPSPQGEFARIVPRYAGEVDGTPMFKVYLEMKAGETKTRRQLLAELPVDIIAGPSAMARGPQLLRWAGDLDGDDKLDLIMNFSSRYGTSTTATLFLSSAAKADDLVGVAGGFGYWPVGDPGC